jgi:ankyrin repeat protein
MTELHEAAANDDVKTLHCVLVGSDIDIDAEDWDWGKRTALHIAASNGNFSPPIQFNPREYSKTSSK